MMMPGRNGVTDVSNAYRYGFQGQERDDEIKGRGNSLNYKYRMHDPLVGRFFAVDPLAKKYPWYTPYSFSGNKVIQFIELEGLEEAPPKPNTHTTVSGDTYGKLAKKYDVTVDQLREWNGYEDTKIPEGVDLIVSDPSEYNTFRSTTVGEYYGGGDVEIILSGQNYENETVITEQDKKRSEALMVTGWVFDVLSIGQMSASNLAIPRPRGFRLTYQSSSNNSIPVEHTGTTVSGSNRITSYSCQGRNYRVNSSHGYDRAHGSGSIPRNISYEEVETNIVRDAALNHSKIPIAERGVTPYEGKVNIDGHNIGYFATQNNTGTTYITTYFPTTP